MPAVVPLLNTDHHGTAFLFPKTKTCLKYLSESSSGFWNGRIHKAEAGERLSDYNSLLLYSKTFLCHNSAAAKVHTNVPYTSKLGVINELDIIRNCLTDRL